MKPIPALICALALLAGCNKESNVATPEPDQATRLANYESKKWERFAAKMVSPTKTGQLMTKPNGRSIHVQGDLGKAKGEEHWGYYERDGNYDYTAAGGGAERVENYHMRGNAKHDMGEDLIRHSKLHLRYLKKDHSVLDEMATLSVRLENEGVPPILLRHD